MDESRVLERALKNCQTLKRYIYDSIKQVRRLNIRYNSDWLLKNYKNYMSNIWTQYGCRSPERKFSLPELPSPNKSLIPISMVQGARSSLELCGSSRRINYKFIKIKRSMEALILQIQHVIEIGNRQRNYMHYSSNSRGSRTRMCCH